MRVLIKGMEMPTSCDNCPFCDNDAMCTVLGEDLFDHVQAEVADNLRYLPEDWKSDDCPLVPVPPHGRLGDLDELYSRLERWYQTHERAFSESEAIYIRAMLAGVKETPTIIPAEEDE